MNQSFFWFSARLGSIPGNPLNDRAKGYLVAGKGKTPFLILVIL